MTLELTELQADRLETIKTENGLKGPKWSRKDETKPTVIGKKEEIPYLDANTKFIHFAMRPTLKDICTLFDACPNLEKIQVPAFVLYGISETVLKALKIRKVELIEGKVMQTSKRTFLIKKPNN